MSAKTPRRSLIAIVTVVSLLGAVAVVRGASAWASTNAQLTAKPVDAQTLASELRDEQARSATLRQQLDQVTSQAKDLANALQAANDQAQTDAQTASHLSEKLKAAEAKLATLEAQGATQVATQTTTSQYSGEHEGGGDD